MAQRLDPSGWHVFHAGGAVVHATTEAVRSHSLTAEQVAAATQLSADHGWVLEYYTARAYAVDADTDRAVDHAALMGVPFRRSLLTDLDGEIVRLQFVVAVEESDAVLSHGSTLGLTGTSATSPIMEGTAFVSFTVSGITKASGIQLIADELGITLADVMMVGDGHNDLPALAAVGHPVAMGNAVPEAKDLATLQVAHVEDHGVAEALDASASMS